MKNESKQLLDLMLHERLEATFNKYWNDYSEEIGINILEETRLKINIIKKSLISYIENGLFDLILDEKRFLILDLCMSIYNNVNGHNIVNGINSLYDKLQDFGIITANPNSDYVSYFEEKFDSLSRKMNELSVQYDKNLIFINELEGFQKRIRETVNSSDKNYKQINDLSHTSKIKFDQIEVYEKKAEKFIDRLSKNQDYYHEVMMSLNDHNQKFKDVEKDIDDALVNISNIQGQKQKIITLIKDAETALQLNSTIGISSAFSNQYQASKEKINYWLIGAAVFISLAIFSTIWILTGWGLHDSDPIASLIGRIVAVTIFIGGATFCSKQYIRQNNIAEDYAYKAVLSKSILAFTDEIGKRNDVQVAEYLSKVLGEIHKDPLRNRILKNESQSFLDMSKILDKILDKVSTEK